MSSGLFHGYAGRTVRIHRRRGRNLSGVILPQTRGNPSSRILIRVKNGGLYRIPVGNIERIEEIFEMSKTDSVINGGIS